MSKWMSNPHKCLHYWWRRGVLNPSPLHIGIIGFRCDALKAIFILNHFCYNIISLPICNISTFALDYVCQFGCQNKLDKLIFNALHKLIDLVNLILWNGKYNKQCLHLHLHEDTNPFTVICASVRDSFMFLPLLKFEALYW